MNKYKFESSEKPATARWFEKNNVSEYLVNGFYNPRHFALVPMALLLDSNLSDRERRVLIALMMFADRDTGLCDPSQETIAELTGIDHSGVNKTIRSLKLRGWLTAERKPKSFATSLNYHVQVPSHDAGFRRVARHRVRQPATPGRSRSTAVQAQLFG
jgi:hypothetical protein